MAHNQDHTIEEDLARASEANAYNELVGAAVSALAAGDVEAFKRLFSPNFMATLDEATINNVVQTQMIPFFADFDRPGSSTYVTDNQDQFGSTGFVFYTTMISTSGEERPFAIYMVEEEGRPLVANLLVNTTFEDMHEGRSPADYA